MADVGTMLCDDKDSILMMDSCSSVVDRDAGSTFRRLEGVSSGGSSSSRIAIASPAKGKPWNGKDQVGEYGSERLEYSGNNEEIFFGSQGSSNSDYDDFFSVNGEFTPSGGGTPNHQESVPSISQPSQSLFIDKCIGSSTKPPPTSRKKLSELFLETMLEEDEDEEKLDLYTTHKDQQPSNKPHNKASCLSEVSSFYSKELMARKVHKSKKEKTWEMHECCLPSGGLMGLARSYRR